MQKTTPKRIAILGGNPETRALVEAANDLGFFTAVLDPFSKSPAKTKANISYDVDVTDLEAVGKIIEQESIDGVMVGVADPLVPYYYEICKQHGLYCYANERSISALTQKSNFADECVKNGISVIPSLKLDLHATEPQHHIPYPVLVKPVDAAAGVGISVCQDLQQLREGMNKALAASIRKEFRIEKFMDCDDMFAYYTFVNGIPYLSATADRYKTCAQEGKSPVCIAAEYPSRHSDRFTQKINPKLFELFNSLAIKDGVLIIQFFVDDGEFYAYDPGFRLQGEAPHIYLKHYNSFDHQKMLLEFSVSGYMWCGDFSEVNDPNFKGEYGTTVWILLGAGQIDKVSGVEEIRLHPSVISVQERLRPGDIITGEKLGTERQVYARIYTVSKNRHESEQVINFIHEKLKVRDQAGSDMIIDRFRKR